MKKNMIEKKIQAAGLPMGYILQEVGIRKEATFWKQLQEGTLKVTALQRLVSMLRLNAEDLQAIMAA